MKAMEELCDWEYAMGCLLFRKVSQSRRSLSKRTKYNIKNFRNAFPYWYKPVKPVKRIYIPMEKFKKPRDFTIWLENNFGGLPDGEYLLRGWKHRTRFFKKKGMGVRDFRGVFKFEILNGKVYHVQMKSKGRPYGKHKRRKEYFAVPLWFRLMNAE